MGFRDLKAFNTAFLAKQIWRFITNPNLLVSKVVKARYMKNSNWLDQKPPPSASWVWKSIHSAGRIISKGLMKRVGDGENIHIWEDKWIVGAVDGRVTTRQPDNIPWVKVSDLIENGHWNRGLLEQCFNNTDKSLILNMPVSYFKRKDRLY